MKSDERSSLLPDYEADPNQLEAVLDEIPSADAVEVELTLSDARRRLGQIEVSPESRAVLESILGAGGERLQTLHIDGKRREMARQEERQPLRRKILILLADREATPSELGEVFGSATAVVSRVLKTLEENGLVRSRGIESDKRLSVYSLTEDGHSALSQHLAYGEPQTSPSFQEVGTDSEFLADAIDMAVTIRRRENRLDDAIDRTSVVVREATKGDDDSLTLRARKELLATLRQAGRSEEFQVRIEELKEIAAGRRLGFDPEFVLPAVGHLEYELGRQTEAMGGGNATHRIPHLLASANIYSRLEMPTDHDNWREREAWALASLADAFRERTDFPRALSFNLIAKDIFGSLGDAYGLSRCHFLAGFCLRLSGQFVEAGKELRIAKNIAEQESYERFEADSLMQIGEVERCLGNYATAVELLEEAIDRSEHLGRRITEAFARSALGAAQFGVEDFENASKSLESANRIFVSQQHRDGLALNLRRNAILTRHMSDEVPEAKSWQLLRDATRLYLGPNSPAGLAACRIEAAHLAKRDGLNPTPILEFLKGVLVTSDFSWMVEHDPWVPSLMLDVAEELDFQPLVDESKDLLSKNKLNIAESTEDSPLSDDQWSALSDNPIRTVSEGVPIDRQVGQRIRVDAMAGESRRMSEPVAA